MTDKKIVLENCKRLSKSKFWKIQTDVYKLLGPEAWSKAKIPFLITSNPFIARQYALLVRAFIADCLKLSVNSEEPFYIIDLGAGSGNFAYLFLKELIQIGYYYPLEDLSICYVMTDIARKNINNWREHRQLQPFIEAGILDFAYYNATTNNPLKLMVSGQKLDKTINPLIVISNYFFDTIPQDIFHIKNKQLYEGKISLKSNADAKDAVEIAKSLEINFSYAPIKNIYNYYPDIILNLILEEYINKLNDVYFFLPIEAIRIINNFNNISCGPSLFLISDHGIVNQQQIAHSKQISMTKHLTFSAYQQNYHLIQEYFCKKGGYFLVPSIPNKEFTTMLGIYEKNEKTFSETAHCYSTHVNAFDSGNCSYLVDIIDHHQPIELIILLLKLHNYDPNTFITFSKPIHKQLSSIDNDIKDQLVEIIYRTRENIFILSKRDQYIFIDMGTILFEIDYYETAFNYFQTGHFYFYDNPKILCYMLLSEIFLHDPIKARPYLHQLSGNEKDPFLIYNELCSHLNSSGEERE